MFQCTRVVQESEASILDDIWLGICRKNEAFKDKHRHIDPPKVSFDQLEREIDISLPSENAVGLCNDVIYTIKMNCLPAVCCFLVP